MPRTGIRPSVPEAIKALCCDCCAAYSDGRYSDCTIVQCPIYHKMPYRSLPPNYDWVFDGWTDQHEQKRRILRLSNLEYIEEHIIKPNGKLTIGSTSLFRAKCYDCCGNFYDGRYDCQVTKCPIYYWMPYRKLIPNLEWIFELPYTRKHNIKRKLENLTREEYILKYIAKQKIKPIRMRKVIP